MHHFRISAQTIRLVPVLFCICLYLVIFPRTASAQGASFALSFDGVDDFVELGDQFGDVTIPFSLSFWVRLDGDGDYIVLRTDDPSSTVSGAHSGFIFNMQDGNEISVHYGDGQGGGLANRRSKRTSYNGLIGKWYHIAAVVRGAEDMELYVNGDNLDGNYEGGGGPMVHTALPGRIGRSTLYGPWYFKGVLDEFRVWDIALEQDAIQEEMHRSLQTMPEGLVAYWDFNEGNGQEVLDASGSGVDGVRGLDGGEASDDPEWVRSFAPIGSAGCVGDRLAVGAIWSSQIADTSSGLTLENQGFLVEEGDFVVFGHNPAAGLSSEDMVAGLSFRLERTWCLDISDPSPIHGGTINMRFYPELTGVGGLNATSRGLLRLLYRADEEDVFVEVTDMEGVPLLPEVDGPEFVFDFAVRESLAGGSIALDGEYTLGVSEVRLPVSLLSFEGIEDKEQVHLTWATQSETNNAGFEVERAIDEGTFEQVGFVSGNGTTLAPQHYAFTDAPGASAAGAPITYRLKQIDFDGQFEYVGEVAVTLDLPQQASLQQNTPNPFNPQTSITYTTPTDGPVLVRVFDLQGKLIQTLVDKEQPAGVYTVNFEASNLASGVYVYRLDTHTTSLSSLMTLLK